MHDCDSLEPPNHQDPCSTSHKSLPWRSVLCNPLVQMPVALGWCSSASPSVWLSWPKGSQQTHPSAEVPAASFYWFLHRCLCMKLIAGHVVKNAQCDDKSQQFFHLSIMDKPGHTSAGEESSFSSCGCAIIHKPTWKHKNLVVPKGTRGERGASLTGGLISASICKDMYICSGIDIL